MFKSLWFAIVVLPVMISLPSLAAELPQRALGHNSVLHGGNSLTAKANPDSVFLMGPWGSGAQANGQFQNPNGGPAWNGWTHYDVTQTTSSYWHISDYYAADLNSTENNLAMYCGDETYPACTNDDVVGGYGNSLYEILRFNYTVIDPTEPCEVTVSGVFSHNTEPGYDFTNFYFVNSEDQVPMAAIDGVGVAVVFSHSLTYEPGDYVGENNEQVQFEIKVASDGAWSDADCLYSGNGACQVDDLRVQCSNGDYDNTSDFQNGFGDDWVLGYLPGTGDFTDLWLGLNEIDPCRVNYSPQVAFIDDGTKVPGVGPTYCQDWCYGPGGYVVNHNGGAAIWYNPDAYLHNAVESPVLTWPGSSYFGAQLSFGVYRHGGSFYDDIVIYYTWSIRSATDLSSLENAPWQDRGFVYFGGPDYQRAEIVVTDLLEPGLTVAQVQLTVLEIDRWGWEHYATPAPYFDNVRLVAFNLGTPAISAREMDLAQDNFPETGHLDLTNLAGMNVRFDAANNNGDDAINVPGDSIVCTVASVRVGGELVDNRLHYTMQRNPVFDSVRDANWGVSGFVDGQPAINSAGNPVLNTFAYDLPDSGFLFPGDVLHYYITATDEVDHSDAETTTMPANLEGFGEFSNPLAYNSSFQVHCLPSVDSDGSQPPILFWNDFGSRGGEEEWFGALLNIGLHMGEHYDYYYTNAPASEVGNGLGGRATPSLLEGYSDLLYTCGDLGRFTIANGNPEQAPSPDVQLLSEWFSQNQVDALFCGDNLVNDLYASGALTYAFLSDYLNVSRVHNDLRPLINNQATPLVKTEPGNSVFYTTSNWIAYGGCDGINTFDAVTAGDGAERLARFCNVDGNPDFEFSAATLNQTGDDRIISIPYDFMSIYTNPDDEGNGLSTRVNMLSEVLALFNIPGVWNPSDVPEVAVFSVQNYPNPFNPSTRIEFNLPKAGHLGLKVFNVRGELVRTLIDEGRKAGSDHITWDGTNDQGSGVSSGIYFFEARTAGEVKVGKMTLIK